jgi:hypothetical protein
MKNMKLLFVIVMLFISSNIIAQKPTAKPIKFKPPKLTTMLGIFKDSMSISPAQVEAVIGEMLKVVTVKNESYQVTSYQFLYRKIVTSEDETTGKPYLTTSVKSSLFKISPLPKMWLDAIRELPRPGEEIIFFDVIAKDKEGRYMYAPNLKLSIK